MTIKILNTNLDKQIRFCEMVLLFIGVPLSIIESKSNLVMFITLNAVALMCVIYLKRKKIKIFNKDEFSNPKFFKYQFLRVFFIGSAILIFSYIYDQKNFLDLPKYNLFLWMIIIFVYPILSAFPQEIVYRTFFFKRYKHLFDNKITLVLVNAFLFSFAHVIFMNPIVLIFTFFGGIIFAYIYSTTNSLVKVSLEHGLFGDIVFSSGLGVYFYHLTAIQH